MKEYYYKDFYGRFCLVEVYNRDDGNYDVTARIHSLKKIVFRGIYTKEELEDCIRRYNMKEII